MKSSLKLKVNHQTGEYSLLTAEGHDLLKGLFVTSISIEVPPVEPPTVTLTCQIFDTLEVEFDEAEIETHEVKIRK